jgi:sRNA-binding regulator protein Hfq
MKNDEKLNSKNTPVERLSQSVFDGMNDTGKKFYLDLIKKGQVELVGAKEQLPGLEASQKPKKLHFLMQGKNVEITFLTGDVIAGLMTDIGKYEIVIEPPGSSPVLIFKHAIRMICEK